MDMNKDYYQVPVKVVHELVSMVIDLAQFSGDNEREILTMVHMLEWKLQDINPSYIPQFKQD